VRVRRERTTGCQWDLTRPSQAESRDGCLCCRLLLAPSSSTTIIGPFGMLALGLLSQGQVDSRVLARGEVDNSGILPSIHARRCASCRAMQNFAN